MFSNSLTQSFLEKYHVTFFVFFFFFFEDLKYFNTVQISVHGSFPLFLCQTGRQGPCQHLCPVLVCDDQGAKASAASNFKHRIILTFPDLDRPGILSPGCERKAQISSVLRGVVTRCGGQEL